MKVSLRNPDWSIERNVYHISSSPGFLSTMQRETRWCRFSLPTMCQSDPIQNVLTPAVRSAGPHNKCPTREANSNFGKFASWARYFSPRRCTRVDLKCAEKSGPCSLLYDHCRCRRCGSLGPAGFLLGWCLLCGLSRRVGVLFPATKGPHVCEKDSLASEILFTLTALPKPEKA